MKAGSRGATDSRERFGLRRALVVLQVALSLVLVVGALLFIRSLRNLMTMDAGFRQDGVMTIELDMRKANVPARAPAATYARFSSRVRAIPGVRGVHRRSSRPSSGNGWNNSVLIGGAVQAEHRQLQRGRSGLFQDAGHPARCRARLRRAGHAAVAESGDRHRVLRPRRSSRRDPIGQAFQIESADRRRRGRSTRSWASSGTPIHGSARAVRAARVPRGHAGPRPGPFLQIVLALDAPRRVDGGGDARDRGGQSASWIQYQSVRDAGGGVAAAERLMATLSGFFGGLAVLSRRLGCTA